MTRPSDSGASGVNWSGELEAVHDDGRVVPVTLEKENIGMDEFRLSRPLEKGGQAHWFNRDGSQVYALGDHGERGKPWRIRNTQPQPQPADTVTVGRRTADEWRDYAAPFKNPYGHDIAALMRSLGLLILDPTPLDRFMAAHPDADRATAEKALAWGEGE